MFFKVSEIKRANGLVADQEIFALPFIRIPVSRLQRDIILTKSLENNSSVLLHLPTAASSSNTEIGSKIYQPDVLSQQNLQKYSAKATSNLTHNDFSYFHHRRSIV